MDMFVLHLRTFPQSLLSCQRIPYLLAVKISSTKRGFCSDARFRTRQQSLRMLSHARLDYLFHNSQLCRAVFTQHRKMASCKQYASTETPVRSGFALPLHLRGGGFRRQQGRSKTRGALRRSGQHVDGGHAHAVLSI